MAIPVNITIVAKVGAASFEINSVEGDVLHHITGPDFMKQLMDLAGFVAAPDAEVEPPNAHKVTELNSAAVTGGGVEDDSASMGSVESFTQRGVRTTPLDGDGVMEEEPIFSPGSSNAEKPLKTFGADYDNTEEGRKKREAMASIRDEGGWTKT